MATYRYTEMKVFITSSEIYSYTSIHFTYTVSQIKTTVVASHRSDVAGAPCAPVPPDAAWSTHTIAS